MIYDTIKFIWTSPVIMCSLFTVLFFFMITEYMAADTKNKKISGKSPNSKSSGKKKSDNTSKNCKGAIVKRTEYIYFKLLLASFASAGLIQMWWHDNSSNTSTKAST